MGIRDDRAHEAASMYYLQNQTMEHIARHLGVSRSSVSRLLEHARETGIVRITVAPNTGSKNSLSAKISELFRVRASVVPVRESATELDRLHNVALVAAERLVDLMEPGAILGIAWGNTMSEVSRCLPRVDFPKSTVVQLNGASNAKESGIPYAESIIANIADAFGARMVHFPVPAFFDYPETKEALWRERSIQQVLNIISSTTVAAFGVGAMEGAIPSRVYSQGFLSRSELEVAQADGVVGDVCTVLIREDGSTDMVLNDRASGPTPAILRQIPKRLCIVSGASKAMALLGALRAGVATDLVLDSSAAQSLIELVCAKPRRRPTIAR